MSEMKRCPDCGELRYGHGAGSHLGTETMECDPVAYTWMHTTSPGTLALLDEVERGTGSARRKKETDDR